MATPAKPRDRMLALGRLPDPTEEAYAALLELEKQAGLILREVKGFWRDDARLKIKNAAYLYPIIGFIAVTKKKKREGEGWECEEF